MNRPLYWNTFKIIVDSSKTGSVTLPEGILAGNFVTAITPPNGGGTYGFAVQSPFGSWVFKKPNMSGPFAFSDVYPICSLPQNPAKFAINGPAGTYSVEVWIYGDAKVG